MSHEETMESKLSDLEHQLEKWKGCHPKNPAGKKMKRRALNGIRREMSQLKSFRSAA